jgi:1-acyl-sn-glycerol-3-phosphate acyltransferase
LSIIIFPEGTRIKPNRSVSFKPSAAKLAIESMVPIVLIAHNAGIFWPKGMWFKEYGTIKVKIIETITPSEIKHHDVRSLTDYIQDKINTEKQILSKISNFSEDTFS